MDAALHCSIISLYDLKTKLLDKCSFTTFAQCNINPIPFDSYFSFRGKQSSRIQEGRGVSEKVSAVGFCLGSGLFGSYNSD